MPEKDAFWFVPFAGNWRDPRRWPNEMRRSPRGVAGALQGIGYGLPDKVVFGRDWSGHQLPADLSFRRERWRVLETGAMLSLLWPALEDYTHRLTKAYLEACAELRNGLLFLNLGFRLVRDPVNALARRRGSNAPLTGPDWLALRNRHVFGVEVICPKESDEAIGRLMLLTHATRTAMDLLQGRNVNVAFDPSAVRDLTDRRWFNASRTDNLVLDAIVEAREDRSTSTALSTIAPAPPGFGTMIGPIPGDEERETERLRGQLVDKAGQLGKLPHPGIVVVDTSQNPNLMGGCCAISEMIRDGWEDWAANLACVVLVASTWPGFALTIVIGPRYDAFAATPLPGLRVCQRGHLHVDAFGKSPQDCQLDRYDNFAAFCGAPVKRRGRRS
jgi:hypothetical protein